MTVYVDNMLRPYGRMVMCHMIADTTEELLAMADKIGVQRKWLQKSGTHQEHFDISLSKRKLAVMHGAKEIDMRELARITSGRRTRPLSIAENASCECRPAPGFVRRTTS